MFCVNAVDIRNPQKDFRVQAAALDQRRHPFVLTDVNQHPIALNTRINRRIAEDEMLRKPEHVGVESQRCWDVGSCDDGNSASVFQHRNRPLSTLSETRTRASISIFKYPSGIKMTTVAWITNRLMEDTLPPLTPATLYLVATPIGNLEDMSFRAVRTLKECDVIAAEDTRHTGRLLQHYGISKPMVSYFKFNEARRGQDLLERLGRGEKFALVTDAGTPASAIPVNASSAPPWTPGFGSNPCRAPAPLLPL